MRTSLTLRRLLIAAGLMAACLGASSTSCSFGSGDGGSVIGPSFATTLAIRDSSGTPTAIFDRGEPIELVLSVRNRLGTPATVEFPTSRQSDFVVLSRASGDLVWKWSDGKSFTLAPTEIEFAANETKTFSVIWDQTDSSGQLVPSGDYEARGVLVFEGFDSNPLQSHEMGSTLERFTIR
jgi:hypothetical protein